MIFQRSVQCVHMLGPSHLSQKPHSSFRTGAGKLGAQLQHCAGFLGSQPTISSLMLVVNSAVTVR